MNPEKTQGSLDSIDIVRQLQLLWKRKLWVAAGTFFFTLLGFVYGRLAPSVYESNAIIGLKDAQKQSTASSVLSQFGGLGSLVASQVGGASTSLDKLEIILKGEEIALDVIQRDSLLPVLFPAQWDTARKAWKSPRTAPSLRFGADFLRNDILKVSVDKIKRLLEMRVAFRDSVLARDLVDLYLKALNRKLQADAKLESATNREFLEAQIQNTTDPIIREKILTMIAMEIEKEMLIGSQGIEILRKPNVPLMRTSPKRKNILVMAFAVGLFLSITLVYATPFLRSLGTRAA